MKKKMDFMTKAKLIYSGELALFAIAFIVIATLRITGVIPFDEKRALFFNWLTLFGGSWIIADFFWAVLSPKRRKRVAIIDKSIHLPVGFYLISFDLYCLIAKPANPDFYKFGISIVLFYLGACYTFEAIYHFYYPIPGLLDIEEKAKEVVDEQEAVFVEENQEVSSAEDKENKNA